MKNEIIDRPPSREELIARIISYLDEASYRMLYTASILLEPSDKKAKWEE